MVGKKGKKDIKTNKKCYEYAADLPSERPLSNVCAFVHATLSAVCKFTMVCIRLCKANNR